MIYNNDIMLLLLPRNKHANAEYFSPAIIVLFLASSQPDGCDTQHQTFPPKTFDVVVQFPAPPERRRSLHAQGASEIYSNILAELVLRNQAFC